MNICDASNDGKREEKISFSIFGNEISFSYTIDPEAERLRQEEMRREAERLTARWNPMSEFLPRIPRGYRKRKIQRSDQYKERWPSVYAQPFECLSGANVYIYGDGEKLCNEVAQAYVRELGGNVQTNFTRVTDFVVPLIEIASGHIKEAMEKRIAEGSPFRILSEDKFIALIEQSIALNEGPETVDSWVPEVDWFKPYKLIKGYTRIKRPAWAKVVTNVTPIDYVDPVEHEGDLFPINYTAIDIETTGLDRRVDGITELAAVRVRNGEVVDTFQQLVYPGVEIPDFLEEKTHITNEMVAMADPMAEALPKFLEFVGNDVLLGYNVDKFDYDFIHYKVATLLGYDFVADTYDVWGLAKQKLKGIIPSLKLDSLREYFKVDAEGSHRALKDSFDTIEVYKRLQLLPDAPVRDWRAEMEAREQEMVRQQAMYEESCRRAKELLAMIPDDFKPIMKPYIPAKYKDRWPFVKKFPFATFASANVVVTGSSEKAPRDAVETILLKLGAVIKSYATRDCDFCVVLGNEGVTKLNASRSLQNQGSSIRIINDDEFLQLMDASLNETYNPETERVATEYLVSKLNAEQEAKESEKRAKAEAKAAKKAAALAAKRDRETRELENYDGPRRERSDSVLGQWREEFTDLWNQILADDVIEMSELIMLKTWLNRHKRRRDDYLEMLQLIEVVAEDGVVDIDEMQLLYDAAGRVLECLTPEWAVAPVEVTYQTPAVEALAKEYGSLFHFECPFLDAHYTPSIRMPAFDLTDAVSAMYKNGDEAALRELWHYIGGDAVKGCLEGALKMTLPPGIEISDYAKNEVWAIATLTLRMSAVQGSKKALETGMCMMATTFSVRDWTIDETLAKEMSLDRSYCKTEECADFAELLKTQPPSLRMVFFRAGFDSVDKNGARIMQYELPYDERCYGSSARVNRTLAEALGILEVCVPSVRAVPSTLNREALQGLLKLNGVVFDSSGKRETYIEQLMQLPEVMKDTIAKYAPDMKVVIPQYSQQLQKWAVRTQQLFPFAYALLVKMTGLR